MSARQLTADLSWLADRCAPARFARSTCSACVEACPRDALVRIPGGLRASPACDGCGLCLPACPSGALDLPAASSAAVASRIAALGRRGPAHVRCEQAARVHPAVTVPCVGRLSEGSLLEPLLEGTVDAVSLLTGDCSSCPRGAACAKVLPPTLALVGQVLAAAGRPPDAVRVERRLPTQHAGPDLSRRRLLTALGRMAAPAPEPGSARSGRRAGLLALLQARAPDVDPSRIPALGALRLRITADCFGCTVCAHVCPSEALERREGPATVELHGRDACCTGCGSCVEACFVRAIHVDPAPSASAAPSGRRAAPRLLARLGKRPCATCRAPFASAVESESRCPGCRGLAAAIGRLPPAPAPPLGVAPP